MVIRAASEGERDAVWAILEPVIRAGETYTLPASMSREESLAYWFSAEHEVFVAEEAGEVLGTYFLQANQRGGGAHVANCGYMTLPPATARGVARSLCQHSLGRAKARGFRPLPFNFLLACNKRAR